MEKKKYILIGILSVVLFVVILLIVPSLADPDTGLLSNKTVDNISFLDTTLKYEDGISTLKVNVCNHTEEDYSLKTIDINFKDSDENVTTLVGYIGNILKVDECREMTASVDKDITQSIELEYVINNSKD